PAPAAAIMYPSCETVEYARTRLMSLSTHAIVAARSAVKAPTQPMSARTAGTRTKSGCARVTMKTPAVTIVAAWISADTGVGPSSYQNTNIWMKDGESTSPSMENAKSDWNV